MYASLHKFTAFDFDGEFAFLLSEFGFSSTGGGGGGAPNAVKSSAETVCFAIACCTIKHACGELTYADVSNVVYMRRL
jgi:hypothetical protein